MGGDSGEYAFESDFCARVDFHVPNWRVMDSQKLPSKPFRRLSNSLQSAPPSSQTDV
jgi:hypothetical protein